MGQSDPHPPSRFRGPNPSLSSKVLRFQNGWPDLNFTLPFVQMWIKRKKNPDGKRPFNGFRQCDKSGSTTAQKLLSLSDVATTSRPRDVFPGGSGQNSKAAFFFWAERIHTIG